MTASPRGRGLVAHVVAPCGRRANLEEAQCQSITVVGSTHTDDGGSQQRGARRRRMVACARNDGRDLVAQSHTPARRAARARRAPRPAGRSPPARGTPRENVFFNAGKLKMA